MHVLFEYWEEIGESVPYFFPVSASKWQNCFLQDELDGERTFKELETYIAKENGQVLGFIQYGQPNFECDESGQKYYNPHIGVIRHLYFEKGRNDIGDALLAKAEDYLAYFDNKYAFYHILGMSCNAHHGKLHNSQSHVDQLLRASGFQIEHENVYFVLDMTDTALIENSKLCFCSTCGSSEESFDVRMNTGIIGNAHIRYLNTPTDGYTRDTAYLTWIGVVEQHRSQGLGTEFLKLLVQYLLSKQYRYLHTDTANSNVCAKQFYKKLGFQKEGYTRSYVQA